MVMVHRGLRGRLKPSLCGPSCREERLSSSCLREINRRYRFHCDGYRHRKSENRFLVRQSAQLQLCKVLIFEFGLAARCKNGYASTAALKAVKIFKLNAGQNGLLHTNLPNHAPN